MDKAALDAALAALTQSIADAGVRIAAGTTIDLTAEVNTVNGLKATVDQILPAQPTS